MFSFLKKKSQTKVSSSRDTKLGMIVPRIKSTTITDDPLAAIGPIQHVVSDLYVVYAFDQGNLFAALTHSDLEDLGLSQDELHSIALENFRKKIPSVSLQKYGDFYFLITGQNYEASMLIDDKFWNREIENFEGTLVAGIPHRDHVMFCDSSNADALAGLAEFTNSTFDEAADNHALSKNLIEWTSSGWKPHTSPVG